MRLDHLLSKGKSKVCRDCEAIATQRRLRSVSEANVVSWLYCFVVKEHLTTFSGGDAFRGNTRSHPEHDG